MMKKLILASTSPRRKELLEKAGIAFECVAGTYEEDMTVPLPPKELVMHLSSGKAQSVAAIRKDGVILAADTIVAYGDTVLGKPRTAERARIMLALLSGTAHSIITGFTVLDPETAKVHSQAVETKIFFKTLTREEIEAYIASGEPLDRAGAYAIQGGAKNFVERIEGDFDSAVGLPVSEVLAVLRAFGIRI